MHIVHTIGTLDPRHGGPPMVATRLATAQARLGHQVTIFSMEPPETLPSIQQSVAGLDGFDRVRHVYTRRRRAWEDYFPWRIRADLEPLLCDADAVHIHGVWTPLLLRSAALARKLRKPYFIALHGMLDPWTLTQRRLKKKLALMLAYRRMLNGAAALHVLNEDEKTLIEPLRLKPPAVIIPNGIFIEEIANLPAKGTFYAQHPELRDEPYILFLSRLHYKKGLDYLAESFGLVRSELPNVRLVVAGPDGGEQAKFEHIVRERQLSEYVHVVGPLYGRDKLAAYVDATCFCLPSRQEGFSMAITEAMGCGVPCVISDGCHFPEVQSAGAGFVRPLNPPDIAAALLQVLRDQALRQRMAEAGPALVRSEFTWPIIAQKTIDMYQGAVDRV